MTDQDKVIAFEKLEKSLKELDDIDEKNMENSENYIRYGDELLELSEDDKVKRYLFLISERNRLIEVIRKSECYIRPFDYEEFFEILNYKNRHGMSECEHSIWLVLRSYIRYSESDDALYLLSRNNDSI